MTTRNRHRTPAAQAAPKQALEAKPAPASRPSILATARKLLSKNELQTISFIAALGIAGMAIAMRVETPVVWTFLATAVVIAMGGQKTS